MVFEHQNQDIFVDPNLRMKEIKQNTLFLIEDCIAGDDSRLEAMISNIEPKRKIELEVMAYVILSKALEEPQHCNACVSLSSALHMTLPALPAGQQGNKCETFMHALLDVFQTEFEDVFFRPVEQILPENETASTFRTAQKKQNRIRAIVHFAGHLYCHKLLGSGVVRAMMQDIVDSGQSDSANELLSLISVATKNGQQQKNLGTVLEDVCDSDGTSSEAISTGTERKHSKP